MYRTLNSDHIIMGDNNCFWKPMIFLIMKSNVGHINFPPELNWVIKPRQLSANLDSADEFNSSDAILKPMQPDPYIMDEIMHDPTQMDIGKNHFCGMSIPKNATKILHLFQHCVYEQ